MGITKQYLRWVPAEKFGLIGSQCSAINLIDQWPEKMLAKGRVCATAACEDVVFWDLKTSQLIDRISNSNEEDPSQNSPISCLAYNATSNVLSSGHNDGTIRLFDCHDDRKLKVVFSGHRGLVSCITFDGSGLRIASGGKDTEIVVWDVANQSGLFRLKGHKGAVNRVEFMKNHSWILISASSDTYIKLWDLNTQHCFKTLVGHRTEVWDLVLLKNDTRLISGGSDSELKVWKIMFAEEEEEVFIEKLAQIKKKQAKELELLGEEHIDINETYDEEADGFILVETYGTILRKSTERLSNMIVDPAERLLVCHGKNNFAECFKLRTDEELKHKMKKRIRRENKRRLHSGPNQSVDDDYDDGGGKEEIVETINEECTLSDEIERLDSIRVSSKICSLDLLTMKNDSNFQEFKIAFLLFNNSIEYHQVKVKSNNSLESNQISCISSMGHRTDVRTVSISSDSLSIMTASSDSVKLWNKSSCRCINTIDEDIEYPLCSLFAPGDKHVVLGTKTGKIQILSLNNVQVQSTIDASEDGQPIWSISLLPDLTGIVSGCEDKNVKFWSFDLVIDEHGANNSSRILTLNHERTLTTEEGVICTKVSPNSKFIAVAMLDSCVKIFFCDSFKFFLSLYGHKLPVLCMDISTDNSLIVTGSSDKNIKIWGMDFGDCHRSLFAHDDNIMCLSFIPKTHQFFTASKDHTVKMWDADNFEKIQTLYGHHKEIWSMAIAPNGKYLITSSHDKSIRLWRKTDEPLVLEEEKEMDNERDFRKELEFNNESHTVVAGEPITDDQETGMAQRKTSETIRSVERLIESIDIYLIEVEKSKFYQQQCAVYDRKLKEHQESGQDESGLAKPIREPVDPHLLIYQTECPYRFMLEVLVRIKSNELEETLLQLPFYYIHQLLMVLSELLQRRWEVELVCRCVCFLIRVNFGQITSSSSMAHLMDKIRVQMHEAVRTMSDLLGINVAGLKHYESVFESREEASLFVQALQENLMKKSKKQKKQNRSAPIMTWT